MKNNNMQSSITRWTRTVAVAAAFALPLTGAAYAQVPATQEQPAQAPTGASQEAAKAHLTAARNTLSQLTQLPAAAQLQGDARTQVAELISNFNALITTQANWKEAYAKVEANLDSLVGAAAAAEAPRATGTAGAVGTSGSAPAIDPAIRAKLVELRNHLDKFEQVALTTPADAAAASAPPAATATATTSTTVTTPAADSTQPASAAVNSHDLLLHVEAIEVILGAQAAAQAAAVSAAGGTVTSSPTQSGSTRTTITKSDLTLNQAQLEQLKTHLAEMRRLLEKK